MWLLTLVLLILLGVLGIADWLKARRPDSAAHLQSLEQFEGVIGAIGLVWGLLLVLRWLSAIGMLRAAGGPMLVMLLTACVMLALSLVIALPLLRSMFGEGDFMAKVARLAGRIAPYRVGLGFACFVLALYSVVGHAF